MDNCKNAQVKRSPFAELSPEVGRGEKHRCHEKDGCGRSGFLVLPFDTTADAELEGAGLCYSLQS